MQAVAVARNAMATRFEVLLYGDNPVWLRAAAEEVLDEIEQLDKQLNYYRYSSELAQINLRAFSYPVKTEPGLFRLLQHTKRLWKETQGVFDITIGSLMALWGLSKGALIQVPSEQEIQEIREKSGMDGVELDDENFTVRFRKPGIQLDLGAIGKGYAIDVAADILRDLGISNALVHGGTSTIYALGRPPEQDHWLIALAKPKMETIHLHNVENCKSSPPESQDFWLKIPLSNQSLSVSALQGKTVRSHEQTFGHILNPCTGYPVTSTLMSALVLNSATESDAFSTALLVAGEEGYEAIVSLRTELKALSFGIRRESREFWMKSTGIPADMSLLVLK